MSIVKDLNVTDIILVILTLQQLKNSLLNKEATLHLPKFAIGTSKHIAQLTVNGTALYTEFN